MKNIKIIFWLFAFFPLGLYFMFKETDWTYLAKSIIAIIGTFLLGVAVANDGLTVLVLLSGMTIFFSAILYFIYAIMRRKQKRTAVLLLIFGTLLFGYGANQIHIETVEAERIAEEQRIEEEEKVKAEEKLAEQKKANKEKIVEKTAKALEALEKVEESPTGKNYESAQTAIGDIPDGNSEFEGRLNKLEDLVIEYIAELDAATELFEAADNSKTRADYDVAYEAVSSLPVKDYALSNKLAGLNNTLTKAEEENAERTRLAEEATKKADEERIAKEKAEEEESQSSSTYSSSQVNSQSVPTSSEKMYVDQNGDGTIKGSVNGIYHTPASRYYGRTKNVVKWFKTISEAEAAGYQAPKQ